MHKKKIFWLSLFVIIALFSFNMTVNADVYCSIIPEAKIDNSIVDLVHIVILLIQIAVPIILVIVGMIDFLKALASQKEDEIKKGQQIFVKRVLAAVLVYFIIAIVKFVISIVAGSAQDQNFMNCVDCFLEGSKSSSCQQGGTPSNLGDN